MKYYKNNHIENLRKESLLSFRKIIYKWQSIRLKDLIVVILYKNLSVLNLSYRSIPGTFESLRKNFCLVFLYSLNT